METDRNVELGQAAMQVLELMLPAVSAVRAAEQLAQQCLTGRATDAAAVELERAARALAGDADRAADAVAAAVARAVHRE